MKVAKDGGVLDFLSATEDAGLVIELGTHSVNVNINLYKKRNIKMYKIDSFVLLVSRVK